MNNLISDSVNRIKKIKAWFASPLWWILKYQNDFSNILNIDFFSNNEWTEISEDMILELSNKINSKINDLKSLMKEVKDSWESDTEKDFVIKIIKQLILKFSIFKYSIYLEAEKSGYPLSEEDRKKYLRRVNILQSSVYWPEISSSLDETNEILSHLSNLLKNNSDNISEQEKNIFETFLDRFDWNNETIDGIDWQENTDWNNSNLEENNLWNIYLNDDKVIEIFNIVLKDIYKMEWWKIITEDVWNFSIKWEKKVMILPKWKVEKTSVKRILELIDHEIWVHAVRWFNTTNTINTTWEWYLETEEWFALLSELLFKEKIENIQLEPSIHHITTFIAENCDFLETRELLKIYYKLIWKSEIDSEKESYDRALRVKRFVSFKDKWANRKDVTYYRWVKTLIKYILKLDETQRVEFLRDFYFSKLSLEDVAMVKWLRESLNVNEKDLKNPLWIWKILFKKLIWEKIFLDWLKEDDFRFSNIEKLESDIKRRIIDILKIIKVHWEDKNTLNIEANK